MKESNIEGKVVRYANSRGVLSLKLNVVGNRGWPDRLFIFNNRVMFIEFKTPTGRLSEMQKHIHRLLEKQNIIVAVCSSVEVARSMLDMYFFGEA